MFFRILKNDLKRKRTINIILFLFITMATMFLGSSVSNMITVSGAVDYFMNLSNVPDSFAISVADGNEEKDEIADFLNECEQVSKYSVIDAFNVTNERITITEAVNKDEDAEEYERTNTLCIHALTDDFMKVFDQNDNPIKLKTGEIAFSKIEARENNLQVGDKVKIKIGEVEQEFTIAALAKDAVFGTAMMSFKRLIISEEDFEKYAQQDNLAYIKIYNINYDDAEIFDEEWNNKKFNVIIKLDKTMINLTFVFDMIIAGILIVVSICLILIAFMVLRFTIVFTLQEDYKEIGIMKAIGLKDAGIKGIYLTKYFAIAVLASVFGAILSFPFGNMLLEQSMENLIIENINNNILLHIFCAIFVVLIVVFFSNRSANSLKRFSAIDAIRNGSNGERYQAKSRLRLWKRKAMKPGVYMACNDILSNPKRFRVLAVTFCIGTLLILLPLSALHTLTGKNVVSLFGMDSSDVYVNNGKTDDYIANKDVDSILEDFEKDRKILEENEIEAKIGADISYTIPCYSNDEEKLVSYLTIQEIGTRECTYEMLDGRMPEADDEIMITDLTAQEMEVSIGDTITYQYSDQTQKFIITGIYQSMMNLGKGFRVSPKAKLDENYMSGITTIQMDVADMESDEACERVKEIFPDYEVLQTLEFVDSMTGGIADTIQKLMYLLTTVVLVINGLITILMMKSMLTKERGDVALMKSIGFANKSIMGWQIQRILFVLIFSIILGIVLSKVLAPVTMGPIFAMMGVNHVTLEIKPLETYVIYPLLLLCVTGLSAFVCTVDVKKVDTKEVNNIE